jgi:hypothetical protein
MPQDKTGRTIELSWGQGKNKTTLPITIQPKDYAKYFQNPEDENSPILYDAILSNLESVRPDLYKKWSEFNPAAHSARIKKRNQDIDAYQQTWLTGNRPESIPFQRYREYATSPNQSKFDFQGLSDIGQRAIKAKYDTEQRASFASEQAAGKRANVGTAVSALAGSMMAGGLPYGALGYPESRDYILNYLLPAANRRLTAIRTGQDVSKALPLGLDPASQINAPDTFGGRMRRNIGSLGRAEAVALAPAAIAAAPVLEAYPLLAMLAGGASMIPAGVELAKGNYGAAGAEALTALPIGGPMAAKGARPTGRAIMTTAQKMGRAYQNLPSTFKRNINRNIQAQVQIGKRTGTGDILGARMDLIDLEASSRLEKLFEQLSLLPRDSSGKVVQTDDAIAIQSEMNDLLQIRDQVSRLKSKHMFEQEFSRDQKADQRRRLELEQQDKNQQSWLKDLPDLNLP